MEDDTATSINEYALKVFENDSKHYMIIFRNHRCIREYDLFCDYYNNFFHDANGKVWKIYYDQTQHSIIVSDQISVIEYRSRKDKNIWLGKDAVAASEKLLYVSQNVHCLKMDYRCPVLLFKIIDDYVNVYFKCEAVHTKFSFIMKNEVISDVEMEHNFVKYT